MLPLSLAKLKEFAALTDVKNRTTSGLFLTEGLKLTYEALSAGWAAEAVVATEKALAKLSLADAPAYSASILRQVTHIVGENGMTRLSSQKTPDGIVGVFHLPPSYGINPTETPDLRPAFVLWDVQDPANVGAILRVANWFGFQGIYRTPATADIFNPKTLRAAMGGVFRVPVYTLAPEIILERFGEHCVAADMDGTPLDSFEWGKRDVILLGGEGRGLPDEIRERFPTVAIPGGGSAESLNVAVAAGILAYAYQNACI